MAHVAQTPSGGGIKPWLAETRERVMTALTQQTPLLFVMGNEASDLDSVASSLGFAYYLSEHREQSPAAPAAAVIAPLINIPRADLKLRSEIMYALAETQIPAESLVFLDEVNLAELHGARRLSLVLVDHNRLSVQQEVLAGAVVGVVDHHADERLYLDTIGGGVRRVEKVGSAATMVADALLTGGAAIPADLALLLLLTVVLDNADMDPAAGKATPLDETVANGLLTAISAPVEADARRAHRASLFKAVLEAKSRVEILAPSEMLRKDYKEFRAGEFLIGGSSFMLGVEQWMEHAGDGIVAALEEFCAARRLHLLVTCHLRVVENDRMLRDLSVFVRDAGIGRELGGKLLAYLEASPELQLVAIRRVQPEGAQSWHVFKQNEVKSSRKQVIPLLVKFFEEQLPKSS